MTSNFTRAADVECSVRRPILAESAPNGAFIGSAAISDSVWSGSLELSKFGFDLLTEPVHSLHR